METFNITVKCKTEKERDLVLQHMERAILPEGCDDLIEQAIVRFRGDEPNVYFSANDETHWADKKQIII
tara:strand:- start:104 stop:310 length:207 start_codon:yes stop_codon:yes gene_type:complete